MVYRGYLQGKASVHAIQACTAKSGDTLDKQPIADMHRSTRAANRMRRARSQTLIRTPQRQRLNTTVAHIPAELVHTVQMPTAPDASGCQTKAAVIATGAAGTEEAPFTPGDHTRPYTGPRVHCKPGKPSGRRLHIDHPPGWRLQHHPYSWLNWKTQVITVVGALQ